MKTEIEKTVLFLIDLIKQDVSADHALKYTQAALNIAHTGVVLGQIVEEDEK